MDIPLHRRRAVWIALALVAVMGALIGASSASASGDRTQFIRSAVEHGDGTATFPLLRGTSRGRTVWFIVLDASTSNAADRYGANRAPQLANARGKADKIVSLDTGARTVRYRETDGFSRGSAVRYVSTDASDPTV